MPFNIEQARDAIQKGEVQIKKGEGITHALMRYIDPSNASKGVKELEKAFKELDKKSRKIIMELAQEVSNNIPFEKRVKNERYKITDIALPNEKLQVEERHQVKKDGNKEKNPSIKVEEENPDFGKENKKVGEIFEQAKNPSMISRLSRDGSYYFGSAPKLIDYAVVKQSNGEFYVFDKPIGDIRSIYRTDEKMQVLGSQKIGKDEKVTEKKGGDFKAVYMPTPIIIQK